MDGQKPPNYGGSSSYRPLLPRQSREQATDSATGTRQDGDGRSPQINSHPAPTSSNTDSQPSSAKKGYRQQVACTNCQKRKSKCDGAQPCKRCAGASQDCVYESDVGIPRTWALKRKNAALNEDNSQLRYIVKGLRHGTEQEAVEILRRIRETQDADDAVAAISDAALLVKPAWDHLPAFGRLDPTQGATDGGSDFLAPAPGSTRRTLAPTNTIEPVMSRQTMSELSPKSRQTTQHSSVFTYHPQSRSSSRSSILQPSMNSAPARSSVRWTPWTPNAGPATGAASSKPSGLADKLNQLCDGFPFLDDSDTAHTDPGQSNAVLYLWSANVPAHPWTTVTDDDDLVSALVTRFFLWEWPWYNYLNKSAFLEDMCSVPQAQQGLGIPGATENWTREFCSPCLVNAICAIGSMSSRHPGAFKFAGDLKSRGHHFAEEAERLIRAEDLNTPSITTMQAIWITMWFRGAAGQRVLCSEFAERFYWMYDQLNLSQDFQRPREYEYDPKARQYWRAISETIWGFYCQETLHCIATGGEARLKRPRIEKTFGRHYKGSVVKPVDLWWPCPDPQRTENSLCEEVLDRKCDLTDIIREMLVYVNSIQDAVRRKMIGAEQYWGAYDIYDKLVQWKEDLPDSMAPGGSVLPHIQLLQANYDLVVITLFRSLQEMDVEPSTFVHKYPGRATREILHPRTYVLLHAGNLVSTMNAFRGRWSFWRHCYTSQCHWLPAFALLFHLRPGEPSSDIFTNAVRNLREIGEKWNVAMWMLQSLKGMADKMGVQLPPRSLRYLENIDYEAPRRGTDSTDVMIPVTVPAEFRSQDSGLFPFPNAKEVGTYVSNLDTVLNQMGDVNLSR